MFRLDVSKNVESAREKAEMANEGTEATEFPLGIGKVAHRELAVNGYTRYEELTKVTSAEILAIHGVGPKAVRILEEELTARGLAFASS